MHIHAWVEIKGRYYKYPVAMFCGRKSTKAVLTMLLLLTLSHVRMVASVGDPCASSPLAAHKRLKLGCTSIMGCIGGAGCLSGPSLKL